MIKFIELETRIIQLKDAKLDYFIAFYEKYHFLEKFNIIFLIFEGDYFFSTASYFELRNLSNQNELEYYFQYESFRSWKKTIDEETLKIFEKYSKIRLILAQEPDKDLKQCKFICKFPIIDKAKHNEDILKLRDLLRMKGIHSYYAKIPTEKEVIQHPLFYYSFSDAFLWTEYKEKKIRESLPLITSKSYEESKGWIKRKKWIEKAGSGKRKIYLIGPCIVNGDEVFTEDELAVLLAKAVEQEGLAYEVIKICMSWFQFDTPTAKILEYDIYKNDIVIFLDEAIEGYDLDLTKVFKDYKGNDWLYVDVPIHTTKRGNEQIASALVKEIVLPRYKKSYLQDNDIILQHGKKQLTCREKKN